VTAGAESVQRPRVDEDSSARRLARAVGWTSFVVGTVFRVIALWFVSQIGPGSVRLDLGITGATFVAADVVGTASAIVGALIVARHPTNVIGWLYVITGVVQGVLTSGTAWFAAAGSADPVSPGFVFAWLSGVVDFSIPFSFAAFVLSLFPDGRVIGPRWRWVVTLAIVGELVRAVEVGFGETRVLLVAGATNPYRLPGTLGDALEASSRLGVGSLLVESSLIFASISLALRYRHAGSDGRRQIRWIVFAGFVAVLGAIPLTIGYFQPAAIPAGLDLISILFLSLAMAPIATLIAITRYRLYEIDRIVNRTLLYGSLTAILAGIFTAAVGLAQRVFVLMSGQSSDAAIVLTTLVVATLYAPLRKWLEGVIDRRFKYEVRLGAYAHDLQALLSLTEPREAAQRLIREAVRELQATGGAVLARDGSVAAVAGHWPLPSEDGAIRRSIAGGTAQLHAIVLGPRRDGRPHEPAELADLERVAALAARASRRSGASL
jgi:hypothetical protein